MKSIGNPHKKKKLLFNNNKRCLIQLKEKNVFVESDNIYIVN